MTHLLLFPTWLSLVPGGVLGRHPCPAGGDAALSGAFEPGLPRRAPEAGRVARQAPLLGTRVDREAGGGLGVRSPRPRR